MRRKFIILRTSKRTKDKQFKKESLNSLKGEKKKLDKVNDKIKIKT